jgi:hypothetical protein
VSVHSAVDVGCCVLDSYHITHVCDVGIAGQLRLLNGAGSTLPAAAWAEHVSRVSCLVDGVACMQVLIRACDMHGVLSCAL